MLRNLSRLRHRQYVMIPVILGIVTIMFFWHVVFPKSGYGLTGSDLRQYHYPLLQFVVSTVRDTASIPLWNPHQFLGFPVLGNPQYGLTYPPSWLLLLFPGDLLFRGVGLLIVLHFFWSAWGMTLLAREWGATLIPALLSGIILTFSGYMGARIYAGHYAIILPLTWLPWVLLGYHVAVQKKRLVWVIPGGIALGLQFAAGHVQVSYITGLALLAQWLYEIAISPKRQEMILKTRSLILILVVGVLLSAISWLPAVEWSRTSIRAEQQTSLEFSNQHAIPAQQLIATLVVPNLFGRPPDFWGGSNYEESTAYWGLLPLLLLPVAFKLRKRRIGFFALLAVFGLFYSLGSEGGLFRFAYTWIPFTNGFRVPERTLAVTGIGLAGLLGLTLSELAQLSDDKRGKMLRPVLNYLLPVCLAILWGTALISPLVKEDVTYQADQFAMAGLFLALVGGALWLWSTAGEKWGQAALVLLCVIAVWDVWRMTWLVADVAPLAADWVWGEANYDVPKGAAADFGRVMQLAPVPGTPNGSSWTGHDSSQGYDPLAPLDWEYLNSRVEADPGGAINRIYGVRYAIAPIPLEDYDFASAGDFELIGLRPPLAFYENTAPMPRAYLVEHYEVEANRAAALDRIAAGEFSQPEVAMLEEAPPRCSLSGDSGTARITDYAPNHVTVEVNSSGTGLLILSDQYDNDWKVTVDGESANLLRANIAMRAVCVPDGRHEVRFTYSPWTLYAGGLISGLSWLGVLVIGWREWRKKASGQA